MDELIVEHLALARRIAKTFLPKVPGGIDPEDLEAAAYFGLFDAARRFDAGVGVEFRTFAGWRIRGSVVDWLRSEGVWRRGRPRPPHRSLSEPLPGCRRTTLGDTVPARDDGRREAAETFEAATTGMRRRDRVVARLVFLEGREKQEAAAEVGMTPRHLYVNVLPALASAMRRRLVSAGLTGA